MSENSFVTRKFVMQLKERSTFVKDMWEEGKVLF